MARTAFDSIRNKIALLQHAMDTTKKTYVLESEELDTDHMSSLTFRVVEDDNSLELYELFTHQEETNQTSRRSSILNPYELFTHHEETNQTSRRSSIENARGRKRFLEEKMYQQLNRIQRKGHRNRNSILSQRQPSRRSKREARQSLSRFEDTCQQLNRMQSKGHRNRRSSLPAWFQ